ncbi:PREDICTED: eukaryotic translation initiation factor 4E-1-like [Tarenaya hassleriana]|uniref:eukaryotic translation initiation factor 4E-1-like n=1 Tax=Tarenaya hassleriana TaxID=28532 RepID=UPI00053C9FC2|nr:PREDICTED: eukaryotic translation initiation factor 4E-1-like [Tarenaya hassleriana]
MAVEEISASSSAAEENINPNTASSISLGVHFPAIGNSGGGEEGVLKGGKTVCGDGDVDELEKSTPVIRHPHPLHNSWTFWFDNPSSKSKQATWGSSMRSMYTFATVEEFWSLYNNMYHPSKLAPGADLYCFKHEMEPKWEDPECSNGGKWTMIFPRGKSDTNWLHTLLAMVGEQFDEGDEICGAVVNVRPKQDKISLWTKNAANEQVQIRIGKQWKGLVGYGEEIVFIVHEDAKKLDRAAKSRYTL